MTKRQPVLRVYHTPWENGLAAPRVKHWGFYPAPTMEQIAHDTPFPDYWQHRNDCLVNTRTAEKRMRPSEHPLAKYMRLL